MTDQTILCIPPGFRNAQISETSDEYFINMGPQHPSTHGVLRLVLRLDGETVRECVPHLGYIHRGIEKQGESLTCLQYIHLTDRIDYICPFIGNLGYCLTVEKALGIGVPERGEYIRVIVSELQRIQSHLLYWGAFGADLGAVTAFLLSFKEREIITDIFDQLCGSRLTMNFFRPGGCVADLPEAFLPRVKAFIERMKGSLEEFDRLITGNIVVRERTIGIGLLPRDKAVGYGCSGPVARGSGICYDVRRHDPYSIYDRFEFDIPVYTAGDCYARYLVRMEEMRESLKILEQAVAAIPGGPWRTKDKPPYRLGTGSWYSQVETARGTFGTYIVSDRDKADKPYRIHHRSPSFSNLSAIGEMVVGLKIADVIAVISSLDVVVPEIDR